jgi:hypothetical protein
MASVEVWRVAGTFGNITVAVVGVLVEKKTSY